MEEGWTKILSEELNKEYMIKLNFFLKEEYHNTTYPAEPNILRALSLTNFNDVRVLILGQDPYHQPNQANGLAFAVNEGVAIPPSLRNIFKEVKASYGETPNSSTLEGWAEQGVLLLNTVLTVRANSPNSHKDKGWEIFTNKIIEALGEREDPLVFMLWGSSARSKRPLIRNKAHLILEAPHPSPLSAHRGFLGCKHFIEANNFLKEKINWTNSRSSKNAY